MVTDSGLHIETSANAIRLMFNGKEIDVAPAGYGNSFGTYILGNKLHLNGMAVAESESAAEMVPVVDDVYLNEVLLTGTVIGSGECINITIDDYNVLLAGGTVSGYKRYREDAVYNIVSDVSTAPKITYSVVGGIITFSTGVTADAQPVSIYNNAAGFTENTIDSSETVLDDNPPFAAVRWFNPVIPVGGTINLSYHVDDQKMSSTNYDEMGKTFTVIVKTSSGSTVKNTTYAGDSEITTPAFSSAGETWFSVEVIDSDGVGSPVQYFDILVRNAVIPNYYEMQEEDLETYGIKVGDCSQVEAYMNKAALSELFASAKEGGYNGIKMLDAEYFIDYHKNISNVDGEIDFGSQTYYKAMVANNIITSVDVIDESEAAQATRTYPAESAPVVGQSCNTTDEYRIFVINTATNGDDMVFPDEFTVDLNGATIAAMPSSDIKDGKVFNINGNFDTHIINGKAYGNYRNYNFPLAAIKTGVVNPSEHLCVCHFNDSRYCSFEDVEFAYSVGYDAGAAATNNWRDHVAPSFTDGNAVNLATGVVVDATGMLITQRISVDGVSEISFGRGGNAAYQMGKRREVFYSFYGDNDAYIYSVKSSMYYPCKVPSGAKSVIMTGYGSTTDWPLTNALGSITLRRDMMHCLNVGFENCSWHHTRTCASHPAVVRGFYLIGCQFDNIAIQDDKYSVTAVLGDIEDGWQNLSNVLIKDCVCGKNGQNVYTCGSCLGLDFTGNKGIGITERSGIEYGFFDVNDMTNQTLNRSADNPIPFVVYRNNNIGKLVVNYNGQQGTYWAVTPIPVVAMSYVSIEEQCGYKNLNLKHSKNGSKVTL